MTRRPPEPDVQEAERLTIWLCRHPEAAAALDRWLNPDKQERAAHQPEPGARAQAEADTHPRTEAEAGL